MRALVSIAAARISAALLCVAVCASADTIHELRYPLFTQPAFLPCAGTAEAGLQVGQSGTALKAVLKGSSTDTATVEIPLDIRLSPGENVLAFKLPDAAVPGMYDLCLRFEIGGTVSEDCQPHSVVVVKSFDPPFTVAHITDYHVGDPRAEERFPGVDIRKVRLAALERASQALPAFILLTGDVNAYPKTFDRDYPASYAELLANTRAPLVALPGNHDLYADSADDGSRVVDGADYWAGFFGPVHRILDYGPFRFIAINTYDWGLPPRICCNQKYQDKHGSSHTWQGTLSHREFLWLEDALRRAGGRVPVLVAHHDPRNFEKKPSRWCADCATPGKVMSLLGRWKARYYIFGHVHENQEYEAKGIKFIATTSVGSDLDARKGLWSIRLLTFKADKTVESKVIRLFDSPPMR